MFENGTVRVQMTAGSYLGQTLTYQIENIAAAVDCVGQICATREVLSRNNDQNVGEVRAAYDSGKVRVWMTAGSYVGQVLTYDASNLFVDDRDGHAGPGHDDHGGWPTVPAPGGPRVGGPGFR